MGLLTQVIAQTVRATITELLPYITQNRRVEDFAARARNRTQSIVIGRPTIIQSMTPEQRDELTDMIFEGSYSYGEISRYFVDQFGVRMSIATICGYANALKASVM